MNANYIHNDSITEARFLLVDEVFERKSVLHRVISKPFVHNDDILIDVESEDPDGAVTREVLHLPARLSVQLAGRYIP